MVKRKVDSYLTRASVFTFPERLDSASSVRRSHDVTPQKCVYVHNQNEPELTPQSPTNNQLTFHSHSHTIDNV